MDTHGIINLVERRYASDDEMPLIFAILFCVKNLLNDIFKTASLEAWYTRGLLRGEYAIKYIVLLKIKNGGFI